MIRNLKVLIVAALAVTAYSAFVSAANAAPRFTAPGAAAGEHTRIITERDAANPPEGTTPGQTSHHVFDIRKADGTGVLSITCNEAFATNGTAISGPEPTTVTTTIDFRGSAANPNCTFAGQSIAVSSGNCEFNFTPSGEVHIRDDNAQAEGNHCRHGQKPIGFENPVLGCKVEVGEQTVFGVKYHHGPVTGGKQTITLEANNLAIEYNATGVGCPYGTTTNGLYTTGNTIVRGERGAAGNFVDVTWDAN